MPCLADLYRQRAAAWQLALSQAFRRIAQECCPSNLWKRDQRYLRVGCFKDQPLDWGTFETPVRSIEDYISYLLIEVDLLTGAVRALILPTEEFHSQTFVEGQLTQLLALRDPYREAQ
jgi:hypothetical protein